MRRLAPLALCVAVAGCALKGDVRRVQAQVDSLRVETARADQARAVALDSVAAALAVVSQRVGAALTGLGEQEQFLNTFRGEVSTELLSIQQQLVQIQELTGQSSRRLTDLRGRLERRQETLDDSTEVGTTASADQAYRTAQRQLMNRRYQAARLAFGQFLVDHPSDGRVPDALFHIAQTFEVDSPDSAASYYQRVVEQHAQSERAPGALFKLATLAEDGGDTERARQLYQRLIESYPTSIEAGTARERVRP